MRLVPALALALALVLAAPAEAARRNALAALTLAVLELPILAPEAARWEALTALELAALAELAAPENAGREALAAVGAGLAGSALTLAALTLAELAAPETAGREALTWPPKRRPLKLTPLPEAEQALAGMSDSGIASPVARARVSASGGAILAA